MLTNISLLVMENRLSVAKSKLDKQMLLLASIVAAWTA